MKLKICGTYGIKEGYLSILKNYNYEVVKINDYNSEHYIMLNSLEELLELSTSLYQIDRSEMIITRYEDNIELEIYNGYRE
jgi:hypothetical protein